MKVIDITLPDFAFLDSANNPTLDQRNVILHVRSASVVEIFERENCLIKDGVLGKKFTYTNILGGKEEMIAVLHYSATLDAELEAEKIKKEVVLPTIQWYCDYCHWEDRNVIDNEDLTEYL